MIEDFKTSVRVIGADQVDEFQALCVVRGRRPHQLAADMVLDAVRAAREDPVEHEAVRRLVEARRAYAAAEEARSAPNVIDLQARRSR